MTAWALAFLLMAAPVSPVSPVSPAGGALFEHVDEALADARVGGWVTYQIDGGGGADRLSFWRLAVVGEEKDAKGRDALWLEVEIGSHAELSSPLTQLRMLVARDRGLTQEGVTRLFVTVGYEKPQELTQASVDWIKRPPPGLASPPPSRSPVPLSIRKGKQTRLMTLAGTVWAVPVEVSLRRTVLKRIWVSPQIPLLHVAKIEIPAIAYRLEVRDFGIDAKPRMVLPGPNEPKIQMEQYGEAFSGAADDTDPP